MMIPQSVSYTADGVSTTFGFAFPVFEPLEIEVLLGATIQASGYTLLGDGADNGGAVVFASAPANGVTVTLRRVGKIQVSGGDAPGFLEAKVVAGANVTVTKTADVDGEHLSIAATANPADFLAKAQNLADLPDKAQARINLGLATVAASGSYNDLSNKPTLGTAAALDVGTGANQVVQLDINAKLPAVDGSQLTGIASGGFRNLLINTDFISNNIVNQRSYVSGTATSGDNRYTIDRWRVVTGGQAVSWSNGAVTAPAGGLEQVVDGALIPRTGTYVISWTGTAACTIDGVSKVSGDTVTLTNGIDSTIRFSGGTVQYPQVEYGAHSTSYEVVPKDIVFQRCVRYYWRAVPGVAYGPYGSGPAIDATQATMIINFPSAMRSVPSVGFSAQNAFLGDTGPGAYASTQMSVAQVGTQRAIVAITVSSGFSQYNTVSVKDIGAGTSWIDFTAEL